MSNIPRVALPPNSQTFSTADPLFTIKLRPAYSDRHDTTARRRHIRLLADILYLSLHRAQWERAARAWAILGRCIEVDWRALFKLGVFLIEKGEDGTEREREKGEGRVVFLKTAMLRYPEGKEAVLQELILQLISLERYREALDELTLYLPTFPYHENPILHTYAGLISIYLAQQSAPPSQDIEIPPDDGMLDVESNDGGAGDATVKDPKPLTLSFDGWSYTHLRSAQKFLERAVHLDPGNPCASACLDLISTSPVGRPSDNRHRSAAASPDYEEEDPIDIPLTRSGSSRTLSMVSDVPLTGFQSDGDDDAAGDDDDLPRTSKRMKMERIDEDDDSTD